VCADVCGQQGDGPVGALPGRGGQHCAFCGCECVSECVYDVKVGVQGEGMGTCVGLSRMHACAAPAPCLKIKLLAHGGGRVLTLESQAAGHEGGGSGLSW